MKFEITCAEHKFDCTPFTLDEYQGLIEAKLNGTMSDSLKALLDRHVAPGLNLPKHQMEGIMLKLWANSLGDINQEKDYICDCGKEHKVFLNYNYIDIPKETGFEYNLGGIKLKLRYPKLFEDKNHINMVVSCITHVITESQVIPIAELSEQEIEDLYSTITKEVIEDLVKELLRPTISLGVPLDCECPAYIIKGLPEFLSLVG